MTTKTEHTETTFDFGDGWGAVPAVQRPNGAWCAKSAEIGSDAEIGSYAKIGSDAKIGSAAEIIQCGPVGSRNAMLHVYPLKDGTVACSTGCFCQHTLAELLAACAETHGPDSPHTKDYTLLATAAFAVMEARVTSHAGGANG